jgi:aldo/keto reductase family protein
LIWFLPFLPGRFISWESLRSRIMSGDDHQPIPLRKFGRGEVQISALAMGGHHLGDATDATAAKAIVHEAIDGGVTFLDNCWECHRGKSEDWMGGALKGKRDKVFLMTKVCTHGRDGSLALQMLNQSLLGCCREVARMWPWKARECTGSRSTPLEGGAFEIVVANAQHVKKVPGRKTGVKDAEWPRLAPSQLHSAVTHPRTARLDTVPSQAGGKPDGGAQSSAEAVGDRQYQVGRCGH